MKKENEASRATGNTTDVAILTKSSVSLHSSQADVNLARNIKKFPSIYFKAGRFD